MEPIDYNKLISVEEMKEDARFYFVKLFELHPNPYYYCSGYDFYEKINTIFNRFSTPMTVKEFLLILSEINTCLDDHSAIKGFAVLDNGYYCPDIIIKDQMICLQDGRAIESINDFPADKLKDFYTRYLNPGSNLGKYNYKFESCFSGILNYFDIQPPYMARFANGSATEPKTEKPPALPGLNYYIYPTSSTAIIDVPFFMHNKKEVNDKFLSFRNEIDQHKIKNVFINVSFNADGNNIPQIVYDLVTHNTVFGKLKRFRKNESLENEYYVISEPYQGPINDRILFVIQGPRSTSATDYFCREIKYNKLGILVGGDAGGTTKDFTATPRFNMPNSGFPFGISTVYVDYSETCPDPVLKPDMYWDIRNKYHFYRERTDTNSKSV